MNNLIRKLGDGTAHTGEVSSSRVEMIDINEIKRKYDNAKEYFFQAIIKGTEEERERALKEYERCGDIFYKAREKLRC